MKNIKTINRENVIEKDTKHWRKRTAARGIIINDAGKIGILNVSAKNYYKLPGGGIEGGEDARTALRRECIEELGTDIKIDDYLGSIKEYRKFSELVQVSHCYIAYTVGKLKHPKYTKEETDAGFKSLWVDKGEALRLMKIGETTDIEGKYIEDRDRTYLQSYLDKKSNLG